MLNLGLIVSEKYFFHTITPIYLDEFLSGLMLLVITNKDKTTKDLISLLGKSNFIKLVTELNVDDKEINTTKVSDNIRIIRFMPKQRQIFFSDGKYDLFYDLNAKFLSIGVINGNIRQSKIYMNINTMGKLLGIVRDFMSKLCRVSNAKKDDKTVSPNKINEVLNGIKSNSVKVDSIKEKVIEGKEVIIESNIDKEPNQMMEAFQNIEVTND